MTPTQWQFRGCTGYAYFMRIANPAQFLSRIGLKDQSYVSFGKPRGLRFWFVNYPDARPVGGSPIRYRELSMAVLVDVDDTIASCTTRAWHLPALYVTDPTAQRVGVKEFGFPKKLGMVSMPNGNGAGSYWVNDQHGQRVLELSATNLGFHPLRKTPWIKGIRSDDQRYLYEFWPRCVQLLNGEFVSPRLHVDVRSQHISTNATVRLKKRPTDTGTPFAAAYQTTGIVLKVIFNMTLHLEDNVCVSSQDPEIRP